MRVLVVSNLWPSRNDPARGGFVRDQVESLRALEGLEVDLFTFDPGGWRPYARAARELRRRHRGRDYDVVHVHYGLTGWSALALRGAPLAVTYHGTDLGHRAVGPLSRALARLVDLPATVSASLARGPHGIPGAGRTRRVAVLPCGVNLDRFRRTDRAEARRSLGLDPGARYLLLPADPGRPEKRADRAVELAEATGSRLLTYEGVSPADVPAHVNAANAVVVTSEREGFGLGTLEALACDVPVLSTPVGVAPLALAGIAGALCAPFELRRWADALRPHLDSPDARIAGRARAAIFGRGRMAERVLHAYAELAGEAQPAATGQ